MRDAASETVACYYCGARLDTAAPGRLDQCSGCGRYVHVCRMCAFYDPNETSKQCAEDDAEEVRDKQGANFCDYFRLATEAFDAAQIRADAAARNQLEQLFGDTQPAADPLTKEGPSEEARMREDAEALFRK